MVVVQLHDLTDEVEVEAWADDRVLTIQRMLLDVLADELGAGRNLTLATRNNELEDVLKLVDEFLLVALLLDELLDDRDDTDEVTLAAHDLVQEQFLVLGSLAELRVLTRA